ncbi:uncharacterized transporter slc-17.2 [Procambarus clarkii]|uniref:uncharacterized transporter slc-17.2 n=1 Tax=Procambarus clarkii TaxID=6728 RepID=UPI001E6741DC|nr:uncharacterized transporter slc-17.2-like [Procambarus clarkii]
MSIALRVPTEKYKVGVEGGVEVGVEVEGIAVAESVSDDPCKSPLLASWRFWTIILAMMGTVQLVMVRMSLSMALVCMVAPASRATIQEPSLTTHLSDGATQGTALITTQEPILTTQGPVYTTYMTQRDVVTTQEGVLGTKRSFITSEEPVLITEESLITQAPNLTFTSLTVTPHTSLSVCGSVALIYNDDSPPEETLRGHFNWNKVVQGRLLSSLFCGYIPGTILGGWACDRWGGRLIMVLSVGLNAVTTLLLPLAAHIHHGALYALRAVQGFTEGMGLNAHPYLLARWGSSPDLSLLTSLIYASYPLGVMVSHPLISFLCIHGPLGGWPFVFYLMGVLGCAWTLTAMLLLHNSPFTHPFISQAERRYFRRYGQGASVGRGVPWRRVPWARLLRSMPVLALMATTIFGSFGYFAFTLHQPLFMRDIFAFSIRENGIMSSLPWLVEVPLSLAVGVAVDTLKRRHLSLTTTKKTFNTLGLLLAGLTPLVVVEAPCEWRWWASVALLMVVMGNCMMFVGGYQYTPVDLAPPYAATLSGLANSFTGLNGLMAPMVVAYLTPTGSRAEWRLVFWVSAILGLLGIGVFLIWGSADTLSWVCSASLHSRHAVLPKPDKVKEGSMSRSIIKHQAVTEEITPDPS